MKPLDMRLKRLDLTLPPFEAYRRLRQGFKSSFMLESAVGGSKTVAYSFMGFGPCDIISCKDGRVSGGIGLDHLRERPVDFLKEMCRGFDLPIDLFPFTGGLVGYFSYEFARETEPTAIGPFPSEFPEFELGLYRECLVYDHSNFQAYYLSIGKEDGPLLEHVGAPAGGADQQHIRYLFFACDACILAFVPFLRVIYEEWLICPCSGDFADWHFAGHRTMAAG